MIDFMTTKEKKKKAAELVEVLSRVSGEWMVSIDEMLSPTRGCGAAPEARSVAMFLAVNELGLRQLDVAKVFGGRDTSTVGKAVTRVMERTRVDEEFRDRVGRLRGLGCGV